MAKVVYIPDHNETNLEGMTLAPWMWVAVILSAMLMGTTAAIIPALGASRTSIIDAMRYSG